MKGLSFLHIIPLLLIFLVSCSDKQERFANRMEGTWIIEREVIEQIYADGTVIEEADNENIGTLLLEDQEGVGNVFLDYTLQINGATYPWNRLPFKTGEERKRVFFYNFFCPEVFGCDLVCTIIEDERNRQVWQFVRPRGSGATFHHRKVTWTLTRE